MEKKIKHYITAQLRRYFSYSDAYKKCQKRAHLAESLYKCEGCGSIIDKKGQLGPCEDLEIDGIKYPIWPEALHVDHIEPVVPIEGFLDEEDWSRRIITRMFVKEDKLQYICECCHYLKTQIENQERRNERD